MYRLTWRCSIAEGSERLACAFKKPLSNGHLSSLAPLIGGAFFGLFGGFGVGHAAATVMGASC